MSTNYQKFFHLSHASKSSNLITSPRNFTVFCRFSSVDLLPNVPVFSLYPWGKFAIWTLRSEKRFCVSVSRFCESLKGSIFIKFREKFYLTFWCVMATHFEEKNSTCVKFGTTLNCIILETFEEEH